MANKFYTTIPANSDVPCACCGRIHRKLTLIDGHWLGSNCYENYRLYKNTPNVNAIVWIGYEKKFYEVQRMVMAK